MKTHINKELNKLANTLELLGLKMDKEYNNSNKGFILIGFAKLIRGWVWIK